MSQELRVLIIEDDPDVRLGCEQAMMLADLPVEGVIGYLWGEKSQRNAEQNQEGHHDGAGCTATLHATEDHP